MAGRVSLVVTAGPIRGRRFDFAAHDTFLFGRAPECHARLAPADASASRLHFLLEVNPPQARLRDLGSLNGTHVNGVRQGGRRPDESPDEARRRPPAEVDLRDGDEIRVGETIMRVEVEGLREAASAGAPIATFDAEGPLRPGRALGPWVIERLLGQGGMGAVYLAAPRAGGPKVALKVLLPRESLDESGQEQFLREIAVTRALRHPNVVSLLDCGRDAGRLFFALEYCARGSAEALRRQQGGRLSLPLVLRIAAHATSGLAAAHAAGFVHRDIKPDNVLLAEDGTARLADFGLAKSFQQTGLSGMTATGAVAGSLHFMPREQLTAYRDVRPVSDVWSMAATLYFLLTGQYARDFASSHDPLAVVLRGGTVPLRERDPSVPEELARVLDRALADAPQARFLDGGSFAAALRQLL